MDELADIGKILQAVVTLLEARIRKHTDRFHLDLPEDAADGQGQCAATGTGVHQRHRQCPRVAARSQPVGQGFGRADRAGGRIIVEVVDQGKGIAEDVMAQIGEPFFTTKAESGGTGLGLSISSSIVEKHGGMLRFEPNGDLGTTVSIDLPISHGGVNERKVVCQPAGLSRR
jgi:light-regulated signal transduction histidine kinase (bacteriophytochrome)